MTLNIKTIVDAYATRVDFTDFNLADDINALQNASEALANMTFSQAAFANVETLAAAKTLTDDSAVVQMLNPNSADRDINLPALAVTNHPFLIGNTNGSNYLLTVKNAGGTVIRVIPAGKFFLFFSDGNQWFYSGSDIYKTISPSQITASQNDYNPTGAYEADILRLNSDAARDITGLAGGSASRIKVVHNVGSNTITLKDESGSSTAANRFALSADIALAADQSVILIYDATSSRWRSLGASSGSSSSGVSILQVQVFS